MFNHLKISTLSIEMIVYLSNYDFSKISKTWLKLKKIYYRDTFVPVNLLMLFILISHEIVLMKMCTFLMIYDLLSKADRFDNTSLRIS